MLVSLTSIALFLTIARAENGTYIDLIQPFWTRARGFNVSDAYVASIIAVNKQVTTYAIELIANPTQREFSQYRDQYTFPPDLYTQDHTSLHYTYSRAGNGEAIMYTIDYTYASPLALTATSLLTHQHVNPGPTETLTYSEYITDSSTVKLSSTVLVTIHYDSTTEGSTEKGVGEATWYQVSVTGGLEKLAAATATAGPATTTSSGVVTTTSSGVVTTTSSGVVTTTSSKAAGATVGVGVGGKGMRGLVGVVVGGLVGGLML